MGLLGRSPEILYIDLMKVLLALQMILELPERLRTIALGYESYFSLHKHLVLWQIVVVNLIITNPVTDCR